MSTWTVCETPTGAHRLRAHRLVGYGGGLHRKAAPLTLERRVAGLPVEPAWSHRQPSLV